MTSCAIALGPRCTLKLRMGFSDVVALVSLVIAVVLPALAARAADLRMKGRQEVIEASTKVAIDSHETRLRAVEMSGALDHQTIDSLCDRVDALRVDMDKRFDRLEVMVSRDNH